MAKIVAFFVLIAFLVWITYEYVRMLSDDELESLLKKLPIVGGCLLTAIGLVSFIVICF